MTLEIRPCLWLGLLACMTLFAPDFTFAQALYKCVGPDGRVAYQQTPCAGPGSKLDVTVPSGYEGGGASPAGSGTSQPAPVKSKDEASAPSAVTLPLPNPPLRARGRLNGWPKSGDRLVEGMSPR